MDWMTLVLDRLALLHMYIVAPCIPKSPLIKRYLLSALLEASPSCTSPGSKLARITTSSLAAGKKNQSLQPQNPLRKRIVRTAVRKHVPNFSNSALHASLRTSVYVAKIHFPYSDAWEAHVVVDAYARRLSGVVAAEAVVDAAVMVVVLSKLRLGRFQSEREREIVMT